MATLTISVTSRKNSTPDSESNTFSQQATDFVFSEATYDDLVATVARMFESKEMELPASKAQKARAKLKAIAASCKTPKRRQQR